MAVDERKLLGVVAQDAHGARIGDDARAIANEVGSRERRRVAELRQVLNQTLHMAQHAAAAGAHDNQHGRALASVARIVGRVAQLRRAFQQ
jgi:hypothetical protein